MAAGDLGATDIFSLGAGFNTQSSSVNNNRDITEVLGSNGDIACQNGFNTVVTANQEAEVCGSVTLSLTLGAVVGGYLIRMVEVTHEAGQAPRVTVEGLAYTGSETIAERTYAISLAIDIAAVAGLIDNGLDASAEATSVTHRWECEITTAMGSNGQVAFANSRTPKYTYEESGTGTATSSPSDVSDPDLLIVSYENSDSNQEIDTYTASFTKKLTSL